MDGGSVPRPAAGAKRKDNLRFSFLFELLPFPCFLIRRRFPICDRFENKERQSGYLSVCFATYSQFTDRLLLHIRATLRWVRHNSAARFISALLRTVSAKINCTKRLIRRCRALQHAKELRDTVMSRLLEVADLCSRTVSDTANMSRHGSTLCSPTVEKPLCRSPISQRSHVGNLRQTIKGKGRFTRGWKPQVSTLLCPRRVGALPAEVQRKTLRPSGANTPAAVRAPLSAGAEKRAAR